MTPSLQLWQLREKGALEEQQAFVEDQEFSGEFEKPVGHSRRKAGGMVTQASSGKFQGYRKFQGTF